MWIGCPRTSGVDHLYGVYQKLANVLLRQWLPKHDERVSFRSVPSSTKATMGSDIVSAKSHVTRALST